MQDIFNVIYQIVKALEDSDRPLFLQNYFPIINYKYLSTHPQAKTPQHLILLTPPSGIITNFTCVNGLLSAIL